MDQKRLVEVIKRFPQIWDRSHPYFRDKDARENAWNSIEKEMGLPAEACKDAFKFIREKYIREREKPTQNSSKEWELITELKFLDPNIVPRNKSIDGDVQKTEEYKTQINQDATQCDVVNQTEIDRALVSLVKKTSPIWDRNSNTYPNKQLKFQLWESIGTKLNMETHACMLRWKALREKYIRQKTKFQIEGEKWELLDDMVFLDKVIQYRKKTSDDYYQKPSATETVQSYHSQRVEPTVSTEHESYYYQKPYSYDACDESSWNDSSNDFTANVKHENTIIEIADSSSRKRSASYNSDEPSEKRQQHTEKTEEKRSPEELFGDLVAAILSRKPEKDRNLYMVEIMTVLSK